MFCLHLHRHTVADCWSRKNMVKIDPDAIKEMMPEYKSYRDKSMAATHCHREPRPQLRTAEWRRKAMTPNFW